MTKTSNPQLDRLETMMKLIDSTYVKPEDLASVVKTIISAVKDLKTSLISHTKKGDSDTAKAAIDSDKIIIASIKDMVQQTQLNLEKKISEMKTAGSKENISALKGISESISVLKESIPKETDLRPLNRKIEDTIRLVSTLNMSLLSRKNAEIILEDKMNKEIDSLRKDLEDVKKAKGGAIQFVGSPGSGGKVVKVWDLSTYLDGVTTTFNLPAFWRVTSIESSSSPFTFRPTVDFTVDYDAMSITFTSQIDPATRLAVGQSVIVLYAET